MIKEISAVSFRQHSGEMLDQVQSRHDSAAIDKDGEPVAALVDARPLRPDLPNARPV